MQLRNSNLDPLESDFEIFLIFIYIKSLLIAKVQTQ
jgi:hypothetical protein